MATLVEALESRQLLSAVPLPVLNDLQTIRSIDSSIVKSFGSGGQVIAKAIVKLRKDLAKTSDNRGLLRRLSAAFNTTIAPLRRDFASLTVAINRDTGRVVGDLRVLQIKPGNTTKRDADIAALLADTSPAKVQADTTAAQSLIDFELGKILTDSTASAAALSDANTFIADTNNAAAQILQNTSNQQSAIAAFANDAAAS